MFKFIIKHILETGSASFCKLGGVKLSFVTGFGQASFCSFLRSLLLVFFLTLGPDTVAASIDNTGLTVVVCILWDKSVCSACLSA